MLANTTWFSDLPSMWNETMKKMLRSRNLSVLPSLCLSATSQADYCLSRISTSPFIIAEKSKKYCLDTQVDSFASTTSFGCGWLTC